MALAILCRRTNKINYFKNFITRQICEKRTIQPEIITRNTNLYFIQQTQIRRLSKAGGNYVLHWKLERLLSASTFIIYPAAFMMPCVALDYLFILTTVAHIHLGLGNIITDYMKPPAKIGQALLIALSLSLLFGLLHFTQNDVGVVVAIKRLWAIKGGEDFKTDSKKTDSK